MNAACWSNSLSICAPTICWCWIAVSGLLAVCLVAGAPATFLHSPAAEFSPQFRLLWHLVRFVLSSKMQPGHGQRQDFVQHQLPMDAFSVRLVRVPLKTGQIEILATSLLDASRWPAADFAALYQQRWRIEEAFRHLKCRLQLEQFGGETPQAIRQSSTPQSCCTIWPSLLRRMCWQNKSWMRPRWRQT